MTSSSASLATLPPGTNVGASPSTTTAADAARRWWQVPMVWVVIAGPLSVVIASVLTAVIAWRHIDPVIVDGRSGQVIGHAGDDVSLADDPTDPLAPALRARNHTATAGEHISRPGAGR